MSFFMMLDPLYWVIMLPVLVLSIFAQTRVKSTYARFSRVGTRRGLTGAEAARRILSQAGIHDVTVERTQGWLADHYDPRSKTLRLSPEVHGGRSVASVGVAAHEAGHAIQHAVGYAPMALRSAFVPIAGLGSWLAFPIILIGFLFASLELIKVGIICFAAIVLFQLITLPVEFNASTGAKACLGESGIVTSEEEARGVNAVLSAAALTYVAAAVAALAQLLYFLLRSGLLGGGDD